MAPGMVRYLGIKRATTAIVLICMIMLSLFSVTSGKRVLLGSLDEEDVHEIETTSLIVGILTLILCFGCVGYYWYNKKQQYSQWINEDVPPYIVL